MKKHLFYVLRSIRDRRIRLDTISLAQTGPCSDPIFSVAGKPTPQCELLCQQKARSWRELEKEAAETAVAALNKAQQGRSKKRPQPDEPRRIMPDDVAANPEALEGRDVVYHFQVENKVQPVEDSSLVGRRVKKNFGSKIFLGMVKSCRFITSKDGTDAGHLLYKVQYGDNDWEEYSMSELEDILLLDTDKPARNPQYCRGLPRHGPEDPEEEIASQKAKGDGDGGIVGASRCTGSMGPRSLP